MIADGHKWLNVPYDCGFAFVREMERLPRALNVGAPYLPSPDDPHPNFAFVAPENSRRARALAVWATLRAYGRAGYREMVERHVRLARHLADRVDASPELERLADVPLNIVCFRAHPPGVGEERLNELNTSVADALRADGRVFVGSTTYAGKTALRPAIVNWRTDILTSTSWSTSRASSPRRTRPPSLNRPSQSAIGTKRPPISTAPMTCFRLPR